MVTSFQKGHSVCMRTLAILLFFWLFGDVTMAGSAMTSSALPVMEITFEDDLISAQLVDAPLIDVLLQIKKHFGFKAHYYGDLSEKITLSFNEWPLDKCLRRLTANQSLSVASRPAARPQEDDGAREIAEIWVLSRNPKSRATAGSAPARVIPPPAQTNKGAAVADSSDEKDIDEQENLLLDKILDNPNADKATQRQAIQDLVDMGDADSVMTMASYMANADNELRQMLVSGIGSINNEQATQILGLVFEDENETSIRKTALEELAKRQSDPVAKIFLDEALGDSDQEIKSLAEQLLVPTPGK